jgi:hypothetical protein
MALHLFACKGGGWTYRWIIDNQYSLEVKRPVPFPLAPHHCLVV